MIKDELHAILDNHTNSPFLFVGSGFSRRYSQLKSWIDLLQVFSQDLQPFSYYLGFEVQRNETVR